MRRYQNGRDLLGAAETDRAILVRVKNANQVASEQGGAAGAALSRVLPGTIEAEVYFKIAGELEQALRAKKVDAQVIVVSDPASFRPASSSPIWKPVALGAIGVGFFGLLWAIGSRRR